MVFPAQQQPAPGGENFASGLAGIMGEFDKKNQMKIINDPKASPLQKAIALQKVSPEVAKGYMAQQLQTQRDAAKLQKDENFIRAVQQAKSGNVQNQPTRGGQSTSGQSPVQQDLRTPTIIDETQLDETIPRNQGGGLRSLIAEQDQISDPDEGVFSDIDSGTLRDLALQFPEKAGRIESVLRNRQEKEKLKTKTDIEKEKTRAKKEEENLKIFREARESFSKSNEKLQSFEDLLEGIRSEGASRFSRGNLAQIAKDMGYETVGKALDTNDAALIRSSTKNIVGSSLKDMFGSKPAIVEFETVMQAFAQIGQSPEAQELVTLSLMQPVVKQNAISEFILNTLDENPDISPLELEKATYNFEKEFTKTQKNEWIETRNAFLGRDQKKQKPFGDRQLYNQKMSLEEIWQ